MERKNMDADERLLVQRLIAATLDGPSVYMGGPSAMSMKKAEKVIALLERGERLVSTECNHHGWMNYRQHGTYCPDCWTNLHKTGDE